MALYNYTNIPQESEYLASERAYKARCNFLEHNTYSLDEEPKRYKQKKGNE
jgi:hypothetical protein